MQNSGSLFGWLITIGLFLTLLNFPVKVVYKAAIARLPRESKEKKIYTLLQKQIVTHHRFFALFTTVMLVAHVLIQLMYRWFSWTGLAAAILMVINGFLGGYGHYIKKKKRSAWFTAHRIVAVLLIIAILVHLVTNGR
ncbi:MAG: hypothetical protein GX173_10115 [Ruminococcaceae bacterium]|jgi:hypothetical protein|nr:hypothetical protein [Oscillospiraceae bacterium]